MKLRVDAGTDVAMIGAWDVSRNDSIVSKRWGKEWDATLEDDALSGHLFLIHTGADGGGPIDIYLDEEVPAETRVHTKQIKREFLISVPTGLLVIGGVEDYRSDKPQITGKDSIVSIPSGDYRLRCYIPENTEVSDAPTESELKNALGADDYLYYRKIEKSGCFGFFTIFLFPLLIIPFGWKVSLVITIVILVSYFHIREWVLKRNARYQRIVEVVNNT